MDEGPTEESPKVKYYEQSKYIPDYVVSLPCPPFPNTFPADQTYLPAAPTLEILVVLAQIRLQLDSVIVHVRTVLGKNVVGG